VFIILIFTATFVSRPTLTSETVRCDLEALVNMVLLEQNLLKHHWPGWIKELVYTFLILHWPSLAESKNLSTLSSSWFLLKYFKHV